MPISKAYFERASFHHLHFPGHAAIEQVLRAFRAQKAQWWWLLTTRVGDEFYVCSLGSLLPYLTGRTPHIVHNIGDCAICSGMDPLLWQDTDTMIEEALADVAIRSRLVSDLPMAELSVVQGDSVEEREFARWVARQGLRACGVVEDGQVYGVYIVRMRGDLGGPPAF